MAAGLPTQSSTPPSLATKGELVAATTTTNKKANSDHTFHLTGACSAPNHGRWLGNALEPGFHLSASFPVTQSATHSPRCGRTSKARLSCATSPIRSLPSCFWPLVNASDFLRPVSCSFYPPVQRPSQVTPAGHHLGPSPTPLSRLSPRAVSFPGRKRRACGLGPGGVTALGAQALGTCSTAAPARSKRDTTRPRSGRAGFVFEPGRWVIGTPGRRLYWGRRVPSQHLPAGFHAEGLVRARERRQAGSPHAEGWPALTKGPAGGSQSRPTRRVPGPTATRGRATHSKGYSTRASCAPSGRGGATGPEKAQASSPGCPIAGRTPVPMPRAPPGGHRVRHRGHSLLVAQ